ncbi:hypothetical protein D3C86_1569120 [compost metagenome]
MPGEFNEGFERRRYMAPARVVEMQSRIVGAPVLQYLNQAPVDQMRLNHVFKDVGHPHARQCRPDHQIDIPEGQRALHLDLDGNAASFELPTIQ